MAEQEQKITVRPHGPYVVRGQIPLVRKSQVETEFGEPYDWKQESALDTTETYRLCRCGRSENEPFCDSTHTLVLFDGEETADTGPISSREKVFKGDDVVVKDDHSLCAHAGYCGTRFTNIWKMLEESGDPEVRDNDQGHGGSLPFRNTRPRPRRKLRSGGARIAERSRGCGRRPAVGKRPNNR